MQRKVTLLILVCVLAGGYVSCTRPRPSDAPLTGSGGIGQAQHVDATERLPLRLRWAITGDSLDVSGFSYDEAWEIQRDGRRAFLLYAKRADGFNTVFNAFGFVSCHPSGGFYGDGDGTCAWPMDPDTEPVLVWSGKQVSGPIRGPRLYCSGCRVPPSTIPNWLAGIIQSHQWTDSVRGATFAQAWKIRHRGREAFFLVDCCGASNMLFEPDGTAICKQREPGDAETARVCSRPADAGAAAELIWQHPKFDENAPPPAWR